MAESQTADDLPRYLDRRQAAALISQRYFKISPRTIEQWPLTIRRVGRSALIDPAELIAVAEAKIAAAPLFRRPQT